MRTQVGIIGAGPSGLLLSQLLYLAGIESVVLERQTQEHVLGRIRAGVLEQGMVNLLREAKASERMDRIGIVHDGFNLAFSDRLLRIDMHGLTGGKGVMVYGQTKVTEDLVQALEEHDAVLKYECPAVAVEDFASESPRIIYEENGTRKELECDFVAGCDGYHGVSRQSAGDQVQTFERVYEFGWLGILSDVPPVNEELIYSNHERGFALCSMRSHTRSRYYIQCEADESVDNWTDNAFWDELCRRLPPEAAANVTRGPRLEMSVTPLRSFVAEPLRFGKLFLAGDAGHIVPPTGAKGLNLAASDVHYLSQALIAFYAEKRSDLLDRYSETALRRVWNAIRFSWSFTEMMHDFKNPVSRRLQLAELNYLSISEAARTTMAENYVGLPFESFA